MAYTDKSGKTITQAWGKFKIILTVAAVVPGDVLTWDNSGYGAKFGDNATSVRGSFVAMESGGIGDTIWCALAIEFYYRLADVGICAATDVGAPLYMGASGKVASSAVTITQVVGYMSSLYTAVLNPATQLTTTDLTLSGALSVGTTAVVAGTLTQTGVATFAAKDVHSLGVTITAGGVNVTAGGLILGTGANRLGLGAAEAVTIATGVATVTKPFVALTGEGGLADQLDTLTYTDCAAGDLCILSTGGAVNITVDKANIDLGAATRVIGAAGTYLVLVYNGTQWGELAYIVGDNV